MYQKARKLNLKPKFLRLIPKVNVINELSSNLYFLQKHYRLLSKLHKTPPHDTNSHEIFKVLDTPKNNFPYY